jgi:hypothetical protein
MGHQALWKRLGSREELGGVTEIIYAASYPKTAWMQELSLVWGRWHVWRGRGAVVAGDRGNH